MAALATGDASLVLALLASGAVCGVLWEFWNYWALDEVDVHGARTSATRRSSRCRCSATSAFRPSRSNATRCITGCAAGSAPTGAAAGRCYNSLARRSPPRRRSVMKAIRVHAAGGPEVLRSTTIPSPSPKAGEALVKVDAAGLNYIDVYFRTGMYKARAAAHHRHGGGRHRDGRRRQRERGEGRRQGRLHGRGGRVRRAGGRAVVASWSCCRPASAPSRARRRCCRA